MTNTLENRDYWQEAREEALWLSKKLKQQYFTLTPYIDTATVELYLERTGIRKQGL
jgi:hypothetical protein